MRFLAALESRTGRVVRGTLGAAMVGVGTGLSVQLGGAWWVLAAIGVVPLAAAVADLCWIGPVLHEPLRPARHAA